MIAGVFEEVLRISLIVLNIAQNEIGLHRLKFRLRAPIVVIIIPAVVVSLHFSVYANLFQDVPLKVVEHMLGLYISEEL